MTGSDFMRMKKEWLLPISLMLSGCAISYYVPYDRGIGYSEVNVAKNEFEVVYYAPTEMDDLTAKQYAILRAADIGRGIRAAYFKIENSTDDGLTRQLTIKQKHRDDYGDEAFHNSGSEEVISTREIHKPIVKLTVLYQNQDCDSCLSVGLKIKEGVDQGILKQ